jgi:hypothetical protein
MQFAMGAARNPDGWRTPRGRLRVVMRIDFCVCGQLQRELNINASFRDELSMHTSFFPFLSVWIVAT